MMIHTYNCANYLRETLASVLTQDPGSNVMQIGVIDDHSTKDDPRAVVEELDKGRVGFYQQPQSVAVYPSLSSVRSAIHLAAQVMYQQLKVRVQPEKSVNSTLQG